MQGRKNSLASKLQRNFVRSSLHARRGGYKKEEEEEGPGCRYRTENLVFFFAPPAASIHTHWGKAATHSELLLLPPLLDCIPLQARRGGLEAGRGERKECETEIYLGRGGVAVHQHKRRSECRVVCAVFMNAVSPLSLSGAVGKTGTKGIRRIFLVAAHLQC